MKSNSAFYLLPLISFIFYACTQIIGSGQANPVDFTILKSGMHSGYPVEGNVEKVISTQEQFKTEWNKIFSHSTNNPELPAIDFETEKVILIMLDHKPTGGYAINGIEVNKSGDKVVVSYHEVQPGDRCGTIQAITRPYKLISIQNTAKEVYFNKGEAILNNCR